MRLAWAAVIVFGAILAGGLAGLLLGERYNMSEARFNLCWALYSSERLGYLDIQKRRALVAAVLAAPGVNGQVKVLIEPMQDGAQCAP